MESVEKKRLTDAKPLSKWAMVLSVVILYLEAAVYILIQRDFPEMSTALVMLFFAAAPVIIFSPVYFNLFMDKLVKINEIRREK